MSKTSLKNIAIQGLKLAVAAVMLFWLWEKGYLDLSKFKLILTPLYFSLCVGFVLLNTVVAHLRWFLFLRARKIDISFWSSFQLTFIGLFFNFAVPGGVGGDLVKGYYIARENPGRRADALSSVMLDRLIGLYAMLFLAMASSYINFDLVKSNAGLLSVFFFTKIAFITVTVIGILSLSTRIKDKLTSRFRNPDGSNSRPIQIFLSIYDAMQAYRHNLRTLVTGFFLSLIAQSGSVMFMVVVGFAMGYYTIPVSAYFFIIPVGFIVMSVPLAPAGLGVGQVALLYLFKLYTGESLEIGPVAMTLFQMMSFAFSLLGGYFYLVRNRNGLLRT